MTLPKNPHLSNLSPQRIRLAAQLLQELEHCPTSKPHLQKLLRQFSARVGESVLRNDELIAAYHQLKLKQPELLCILRKRSVRSESGINVIAILTKPLSCPGQCIYCPTPKNMPKSYLPNEPAVLRATRAHFRPGEQIRSRLQALMATGHTPSKIELIVMGGTWSAHSHSYQNAFIRSCFAALNNSSKPGTLAIEQKKNETAIHRCVGLTLETRPDYITPAEIKRMRKLGCTRVEIGVQTTDDKIHRLTRRGHGVREIIEATKLLRHAGFKITYHLMLNLPGSTPAKDIQTFREIFTNPGFCPDQIKIYPCVLTPDSELAEWYHQGKWKPYSDKTLIQTIKKIKSFVPEWCRIIRVIRDIPASDILVGSRTSNLRQVLAQQKTLCRCIRCREIRDLTPQKTELITRVYQVNGGTEYFFSIEDPAQDKLIGLCRLFLSQPNLPKIFPALENAAIIRELHVYGTHTPIGTAKRGVQHIGFGRQLLTAAEDLAKTNGYKSITVISGIGVRDYYRKHGYRLTDTYLTKKL